MHSTQQNFNRFVAPQSSSQSSNPLFTLEPSTTHSPSSATRSLPMKQRGHLSSQMTQSTQETCENSERIGMRQETERVGSLHSKLKQEADKIRRWKTSMEMELKDKSEHIKDMTSQIEEQRKSLLEVQLEYEKVSGLLQEERGNQDQLGKQLSHTRELFSAVTLHVERVEQELWSSGVDDSDLSNFQEQLKRRYEDICENFSSLQGRCNIVTEGLESELNESREECRSVRENNQGLLEEVARLTKDICEKTQMFEESLEKLTSEIRMREKLCEELDREKEILVSQLTDAKREIEDVSERCEKLDKNLVERENEITERVLISEKYQNQCNELITELEVVRSSRNSLESVNISLRNCVEELEEKENKSIEKLSKAECKADGIASELVKIANELSSEKNENLELRERVSELEADKVSLEKNLSTVLEQLDGATRELKLLEERLRGQLSAVQSSLASLNIEKEESTQNFLKEISSLKLENERVVRERDEVEKMHSLSEELKNSIVCDNEALKQKCKEFDALLSEKLEEAKLLTSDLESSNTVIDSKSLELDKLARTLEELRVEKGELTENHGKEIEHLRCKYTDQLLLHSEEMTNFKSLHHSTLQSTLEKYEQAHSCQLEEYKREMETVLTEKTERENELNSLKQQFTSLKEELSLVQNSAIQSKAELSVEKELSERKVSEMFSSLCKYKQESENIVSANIRQLEEVKSKHSAQLKEELERVNYELNSKLESVLREKHELEEELSKYKNERRQEQSTSLSTPKLSQPLLKQLTHQSLRTPKTPKDATRHMLSLKIPKTCPVVSQPNQEIEVEPKQSKEVLGGKNFRTPSIHTNSSFKQKRKKIRLDDVSMEILNSQDDTTSSKGPSLRRKSTKNNATSSQAKENIQHTAVEPSVSKESKKRKTPRLASDKSKQSRDYSWFDTDMVFGLGTDD